MANAVRDLPARAVGIWIRVSTEMQAASDSPEVHEHRARGYAEAKGWEVAAVYQLKGVSGKAVKDHPECKRMLSDVASGRISGLIFSKLARLARNTRELLDFADYFQEHHAALISLHESIDTSSHAGRFFYTMLAALAQFEREEIASRVRESAASRAKMGKPMGGAPPYGYRLNKEKGELEIHKEEAAVRALMYELFVKHGRVLTIARELNERGFRTRKGKEWNHKSVRHILADPVSKGLRRINHSYTDPATGAPRMKPESEWVYVEVPRVVSDELWSRVNSVLDRRAEHFKKRPGRKSRQMFTGLAHCGCGTRMYVGSRSRSYSCKSCNTSISICDLEGIFLDKLREWLTPETVASMLLQADQLVQEKQALLESLGTQLRGVEADIDHLFKLHRDGEIPTQGFGKRYEPLDRRQEQLSAQIASTQGELDCHQTELLDESQALDEAQALLDGLESVDADLKREIVETLVDRITVSRDEVAIKLHYFPFLRTQNCGTTRPCRATGADARCRGSCRACARR